MVGTVPLAFSDTQADVTIMFTHDMHSRFDPERVTIDGQAAERGGYARLKTAIDNIKASYPDSLLLDAGDFSMGTLYQTIYSKEASELRMMGRLGFDATTLGNHEFDYRTQGLTDMINAALASKERLPFLTTANIDWDRTLADKSRAEKARDLKAALERYGIPDYFIVEKGGVKAAIFGINGKESDRYAPLSGLYFKDPIERAKAVVAKIKAEAKADIIICLSHSGTNPDPKRSEDGLLAAAVPDIDVIVSGHTHTVLEKPIIVGKTAIISSGAYTFNLGFIRLKRDGSRYKVADYKLIPIRENIEKDMDTELSILGFRALVNKEYLSLFGHTFDEVLAYSDFNFTPIDRFGERQGEDTLGNLVSDAYMPAVKKAEGARYRRVDVAIVPLGVIRSSFSKGPITVADVFNVSSLGIGPDGIPGYPLVSIYLSGKELKTAAEIDISVSPLMIDARLYMSGLAYRYNPHRLLLNRVTEVKLVNPDRSLTELDDSKLYRVIGGLYSCQMLGAVEAVSHGILKIQPKDENGKPITDFEKHIVYDNGRELKEWVALAEYLQSFAPANGFPSIPAYYNQLQGLQGRKVEDTSRSLAALLEKPNKIFFILLGVVLLVLAIIIVPTILIIRRMRRKRRK